MTSAPVAPVARRARAYFAPVDRSAGVPTTFDPAQSGRFLLESPLAPWVDLGWIRKFTRASGTKIASIRAGSPAMPAAQVRSEIEASVSLEFDAWGKLQMALAAGSQQTNLLATATSAVPNGSGGMAAAPVALATAGASSTATSLNVGATAASHFSVGDLIAVDVDYTGQIGYIGAAVSGAYVQSAAAVSSDLNYVRRVTFNVGTVAAITAGALVLGRPLLAGVPAAGMQVSKLVGFCDREGASFFQEWSALFVLDGQQGDRVLFHYPRLQAMQASSEVSEALARPLERIGLVAAFRALPVRDGNDGESVLCFRSYLPAALREI